MEAHRQIVQVSSTHLSLDLSPALRDRRLEVIVLPAVDEALSAEDEFVIDEQAIA